MLCDVAQIKLRGSRRRTGVRGKADVNMRSSRSTRHGAIISQKWNTALPKVAAQRRAFITRRIDTNVHRVTMIEAHPVMSRGLAEGGHGQVSTKGLLIPILHLRRVGERPTARRLSIHRTMRIRRRNLARG